MPAALYRTAATACAAVLALIAAPSAAGAATFGAPKSFGSTTADVGHLSLRDGASRGTAAASAGRRLFLGPFGPRGFGRVRTATLRGDDHELGPFIATDRAGRLLIVESVRRRPVAVWFDRSGRRRGTQRLFGRPASGTLISNERGDAVVRVTPDRGARRYLFAQAGGRFRRIPAPPRGIGQRPNLHVDPAGRLVATYTHDATLMVARRGTRGRWSRPRTLHSQPSGLTGNHDVDFAPGGDAVIVFAAGWRIHAAWARRGRPFGRPHVVADVQESSPFMDVSLSRNGRATLAWDDPDTVVHVHGARFGRRFAPLWRSTRPARVHYLEVTGPIATWQEAPEVSGAQTIHAVDVSGRPAEQVVETAPPRTTLYSPRLARIGRRTALAWLQNEHGATGSRTRVVFRGALLRR